MANFVAKNALIVWKPRWFGPVCIRHAAILSVWRGAKKRIRIYRKITRS
jgi:hypothetical protein